MLKMYPSWTDSLQLGNAPRSNFALARSNILASAGMLAVTLPGKRRLFRYMY